MSRIFKLGARLTKPYVILVKHSYLICGYLKMHTITITIPDDRLVKLQETATRLGISLEELILMGVEEILNQPEQNFQSAVDYVLEKNAELYKRLA